MFHHVIGLDFERLSSLYTYGILDTGPEAFFDQTARDIEMRLDVPITQIVFVDDHRLWAKSKRGEAWHENAKQGSMSAVAIDNGSPFVVPDTWNDPRFASQSFVTGAPRVRCFAGAKINSHDNHAIGLVCVAGQRPRDFDSAELDILTRAAGRIMEELERRRAARLDHATGAMTRTAFMEQVQRTCGLATRYKRDMSLLLIDVDPFRTLLESLKTDLGKIMIERMGGLGREQVRRLDSFGRLGENIFAVLLPETAEAGARTLSQRLVERLSEGWAPLMPHEGVPMPVTVGIAAVQSALDDAESLVTRAERVRKLAWPPRRDADGQSKVA